MLTPAEELGLSGLALAGRVRKAFYQVPEARLVALADEIKAEARRRHFAYLRDGQEESVHVMPLPVTVLPPQLSYIHSVTQTLLGALKRLPELYLQDDAVRDILLLTPGEEAWLRDAWGPAQRDNNPLFARLDAVVDFLSPMWKDSLRFVEPNLAGIGGLHMVPSAEIIIAERVVPLLREQDPALHLERGADLRELLVQEILDHLQAVGRPGTCIAFIDPKYAGSGPDEQEAVAQYFRDRHGLKVVHADPAELSLLHDEVYYQGERIDLGYRDYPVYDLIELERQGIDVSPMRALFRQNRMISSIAAELDQKSCWEVFTDPALARQYFSPEERQVFRRHVPWTRIVSDRRTTLPDGTTTGLLDYVRREQEQLVLKPNRAFGGEGVTLGPLVDAAAWDATLARAVADPERWVVQQLASIPVSEFPVVVGGRVHAEPFYAVMGFASTRDGLSVTGRASQKQVVNVAQRGGICVVMPGRAPIPLHGPTPA